jgi:hypothetical protein
MPNYDATGPFGDSTMGRGLGPCGAGWSATSRWPLLGMGLGLLGLGLRLRGRRRTAAWSTTDPSGATSLRSQLTALQEALGRITADVQRLQRQVSDRTED